MAKILRSANNYDVDAASAETRYVETCEGRTVQSEKDQADINVIVRNFGVTGMLPLKVNPPTYGDFDSVSDYQSALAVVDQAVKSFMQLPAAVRSTFKNDPGEFVEFVSNPENIDKVREMGLAPAKEPVVTPASTVVT